MMVGRRERMMNMVKWTRDEDEEDKEGYAEDED